MLKFGQVSNKEHYSVKKVWRPETLSKRDFDTGVFLWILRNFQEQLLCKISTNDYSWLLIFFDSLLEKCPNTELFLVRIFLHSEWIRVSLRIQSECGKKRTRKNSVFGHFSRSDCLWKKSWILTSNSGSIIRESAASKILKMLGM